MSNSLSQISIDVSELPAPEPFDRIMHSLGELRADEYLKVEHRKQPLFLYQPLLELGYKFHVQPGTTQVFDIFIWPEKLPRPSNLIFPCIAETERY